MSMQFDQFIKQFLGVCLAALLPVIVTAFISIPYNLGEVPGQRNSNYVWVHDLT